MNRIEMRRECAAGIVREMALAIHHGMEIDEPADVIGMGINARCAMLLAEFAIDFIYPEAN